MQEQVRFTGIIDCVRFNAKDSGWSVLSVHPLEGMMGYKTVAVAGTIFEPRQKDRIEIRGEWVTHPRFGRQIKAESISVIMPDTEEGICKLLQAKGYLKGIGKKTAERIVQAFGKDTFKILEHDPDRLLEVKGITKKKLADIKMQYAEKTHLRDILQFCAVNGIPQGQGIKIYEAYGGSAVSIISRNPYLLTETNKGVKGIGFKKADAMAMAQHLPKDSWDRLSHGIRYVLNECASKKGGTAVPREELIEASTEMLDVEKNQVVSTLGELLRENHPTIIEDVLDGEVCDWDSLMYATEKRIASKCHEIMNSVCRCKVPDKDGIDKAISEAESENGIELAPKQREALQVAISSNLSVITGGPGVGKTTIIKCLISVLEKNGNTVACAAPTGRAAKRMKEATGHDARTIHRLLEVSRNPEEEGMFKRNEKNPLDEDVFIIDESSMIDTLLMLSLLKAIPSDSMLVLVGDVDQLPSVGAGKVLEDIIMSAAVPVVRLKHIFRQAAESRIITAAHQINEGKMPDMDNDPSGDFFFIETKDNRSCAATIMNLVKYIPEKFGCDPLWDVQVLSPKKASDVGTDSLNRMLQEYYIPDTGIARKKADAQMRKKQRLTAAPGDKEALSAHIDTEVTVGKYGVFAVGDKVMQTKNNYSKGVFNGDIGQILSIDESMKDKEGFAVIAFPNESGEMEAIPYTRNELFTEVSLSYACTIHKSQGSEYPYVIIPIMPTFSIMLQRKLIYTGVTRGRKLVCLVGTKDAMAKAVKDFYKHISSIRRTKLKYWLQVGG